MRLSYFLLLVAVMFVACRANFTDAEDIATSRDQKAKTEVADDGTHRHLRGSKKTGGTVAVNEERLALPGVKKAVSKLRSMFSKNPNLAKAVKQKTPGRPMIDIHDPVVQKQLKVLAAGIAVMVAIPVVAVGIEKATGG
uniref:RxLR effector protein n=1 Tax=Phytophthora ramorum TaxID=164328 RepID=H3GZY8_PHYRM